MHEMSVEWAKKKPVGRDRSERSSERWSVGSTASRVNTERGWKDGGGFPKGALENKTCQSYRLG